MSHPETLCCHRFLVHGRVQGVFFRASAREVASGLSLSGYARNLADGSVEVLACGEREAVDKLAQWLAEGPRMAAVTRIETTTEPYREISGFTTA